MYEFLPQTEGNLAGVRIHGKLSREDIEAIVKRLEGMIDQSGQLRLLVHLDHWKGAELMAFAEDMMFLLRHIKDLIALAVVGDHAWEKWWLELGGLMVKARTKYFEADEMQQAWHWIQTVPPRS
ncbi:MAG: STAS/SEC14 domain-containing protein [bacterium]|nr:STAS/SEC14 domain-containing protein [bacterium]